VANGESPSALTELRAIKACLELHLLDISTLRAGLDIQVKHIAHMQAKLEGVFAARDRRREALHVRTPRRPNGPEETA
jgi:hypothetical protein